MVTNNLVIDMHRDRLIENLKQLTNINDMLSYGLFNLFPGTQLELRNVRMTTEKNPDKRT